MAARIAEIQTALHPKTGTDQLPRRPRLPRLPGGTVHLWVGGGLVLALALAALFAPALAPHPPDLVRPALRLQPPGPSSLLGTDAFGRDLFSRVLYGGRLAFSMSILAVLLAALPGAFLGVMAGYARGWVDQILSRWMDAWLSIPGMLLAIVLVARLRPSPETTVLALGISGIPSYFRLVRSGALSIGMLPYIEAARSLGAGETRILFRHVLRNLASPLVVWTTLRLGTTLLAATGLSFIGLGAQPPSPEWGALLASGRDYLGTAWWLVFFPGLAITACVMGFNLLGDGLRDLLDPQTRR